MAKQKSPAELAAEASSEETLSFIRRVKRTTRRKYTPEERVRIVLEGFRGEIGITALCRREGIHPTVYYAWLKHFMEAGKARLETDSARDATSAEVEAIRRENKRLKQLVAELSLQVHVLKKTVVPPRLKGRYQRMTAQEKAHVLAMVAASPLPAREVLHSLGMAEATYYRWKRRLKVGWPARITDQDRFSMSESTAYRVLKRAGPVKPARVLGFAAGKEYQHKTSRPNQMWATDGAYLKIMGWGWYYLVSVLDDYSRYILAWRLQTDMTSASLIEVVQEAVNLTGMTVVPVVDRTTLLTDHGPGHLSRAFAEYLRLLRVRHIVASPYHPQTNGKCERYHRTVRGQLRVVPYTAPSALREAVAAFVALYNTTATTRL
jgi:putative transposase